MQKWLWVMGILLLSFSGVVAQDNAADDTVIVLTLVPPPETRPAPVFSQTNNDITLEVYQRTVDQGNVVMARIIGDITDARALFVNDEFSFVRAEDGWYALIVANIDARPRDYILSVLARSSDGTDTIFETVVTVNSSNYPRLTFTVPSNIGYLINPEVERGEYARIAAITETVTTERFWINDDGWQFPIDSPFTSAFGQYRVLNDSTLSRHTGWDQRAPVGTAIGAIGSGRVAFVGQLDIRGNYVVLDHGWGVYSGYAHLSQIMVERGQTITKGQIIGMSGNTGRSSGPHLHWEVIANGQWVDSIGFLETWLP